MKKLFLQISFLALAAHSSFLVSGFGGFAAEQQHDTYASQRNAGTDGTAPAATTCQPCPLPCSGSTTTNYYVPSFYVQILNSSGTTVLNGPPSGTATGYLFPSSSLTSPQQFNFENTIFSVHIFPPSNAIPANAASPAYKTSDTYVVAYSLKDPAGAMVHTEFQTFTTNNGFPHTITLTANPAIPASTANDTSPQPSLASGTFATSMFIPTMNLTTIQKQQVINGISPISQKFLLTQDGSSISAIRISGTFDVDSSTTTLTNTTGSSNTTTPFGSTTPNTTSSKAIGQLSVALSNQSGSSALGTLTFANSTPTPSNLLFTHSDLDQGLLLNVCIFQTDDGGSYPTIATLRTMDGLKMHKQLLIGASGTSSSALPSLPTNITINYLPTPTASSTLMQLLTTSFLSGAATSQAFTILGPINLRFVIFRVKSTNGSTSQFMVNMM